MLATLVIGSREGLQASLIVGVVAAFLRRNGKSLVGSGLQTPRTLRVRYNIAAPSGWRVSAGFRIYTVALKSSDGAKLSKSIQALQEPLSKIAEKVATVH